MVTPGGGEPPRLRYWHRQVPIPSGSRRLSAAVMADLFPLPVIDLRTTCQVVRQARKMAAQTRHLILVGLFPPAHSRLAAKSGFWKIPEKFAPKVFHLSGRLGTDINLKKSGNWHISLGDTDVV